MTTPENTLRVGIPSPGPSFRGALGSRDFSLLFIGQIGSEVGNGAIQLALPWLVLQLTGSAFQLGLAYFFMFLPMLLFGLLGGVFVDRFDRRLTIVVVDAIRAVAFLSVAGIYYFDKSALTVEYLYAVIFIEASLANFFNPARAALLPNLVKPEDLRAANSLMEVTRHVGFLIAPWIGGVLVELLGPAAIFMGDGVTFAISAVSVFFISWRPTSRLVYEQAEGFRHAARLVALQMADGLHAIKRSKLLQVAVLLGFSLNLIVAPIQVLMPLFVRDVKHTDASYFALLVACLLGGLMIGSLSAPSVSRRIGLGVMTITAVCVLGVMITVASWPPTLWPPAAAMFVAGICIGSLNVAQTTLLQDSTTDEERGRVSAAYYTATLGVRPIAFLSMGALAEAVDIRYLFVLLGVLALCVGGVLAREREVREHK